MSSEKTSMSAPVHAVVRRLPNAVTQTRPTNCFQACVATVLGIPLDDVPEACDGSKWDWDAFQEYRGDHSDDDLAVVRESLERLLRVPDEFKTFPAGYDGEHPELCPPPAGWDCVKCV